MIKSSQTRVNLSEVMLWWAEMPNSYTAEQIAQMIYQMAYRQPPAE